MTASLEGWPAKANPFLIAAFCNPVFPQSRKLSCQKNNQMKNFLNLNVMLQKSHITKII